MCVFEHCIASYASGCMNYMVEFYFKVLNASLVVMVFTQKSDVGLYAENLGFK